MSLDYQSPNLLTFEARFKIQSVLRSFLLMAIKINLTHRKRNKKAKKTNAFKKREKKMKWSQSPHLQGLYLKARCRGCKIEVDTKREGTELCNNKCSRKN